MISLISTAATPVTCSLAQPVSTTQASGVSLAPVSWTIVLLDVQGLITYGASLSAPKTNDPNPTLRPSHRERMGTAYMESPKLVAISPS